MKKTLLLGLLAGIAMLVTGMIFGLVTEHIFPTIPAEYHNISLFRAFTDPLMSIMFICPFILGIILSWIWNKIRPVVKGNNLWKRGCYFGGSYWLLTLTGMLMTYASFQISLLMVVHWSIGILLQSLVAGWIFAKMNK